MQPTDNRASLGCGTLILIALIVLIFGNANRGDDKKLTQQIRDLQSEIKELKAEIKTQSATLTEIQLSLEKPATPEAPLPEN